MVESNPVQKVDVACQGEKFYATPSVTVDAIVTKPNGAGH